MELNGYKLEWPKLACLSTRAFQTLTIHRSFERNFLKDCWNLAEQSLTMDPKWMEIWQGEDIVPHGLFFKFIKN